MKTTLEDIVGILGIVALLLVIGGFLIFFVSDVSRRNAAINACKPYAYHSNITFNETLFAICESEDGLKFVKVNK